MVGLFCFWLRMILGQRIVLGRLVQRLNAGKWRSNGTKVSRYSYE